MSTFFTLSMYSQYALLLSYFQYCEHMLAPDVPATVIQFLLLDEHDGEDLDLHNVCTSKFQLFFFSWCDLLILVDG